MDVQLPWIKRRLPAPPLKGADCTTEKDAVQEALALWERERQRAKFLVALDDAKASLARGEGRVIPHSSMRELAEEVKERGRARLIAELATPRE